MNAERLRANAQWMSAILLMAMGIVLIPGGLLTFHQHFFGEVKFRELYLHATIVFLLFGGGALWAGIALLRFLRGNPSN